jgi:hypothetical protein
LIGSGGAKEARDQAIDALYTNEMITDDGQPRVRYTDDQLNALSFYLLRARLAANLLAQAHDRGDFAATPGDPLFKDLLDPVLDLKGPLMAEAMKMIPPASSPSVPSKFTERQRTLIGAVKDQMISEEKSKNSKKGKDDYDNAIDWLVQVIGNKSIGLVTAEDLLTFKETLLQAPVRFSLDLKTDNILEAIKLIESILSRVRSLANVIGSSAVDGLDGKGYGQFGTDICAEIGKIVDVQLPKGNSAYADLVSWITGVARDNAIEVFTTNYDLLLEEAFERVTTISKPRYLPTSDRLPAPGRNNGCAVLRHARRSKHKQEVRDRLPVSVETV